MPDPAANFLPDFDAKLAGAVYDYIRDLVRQGIQAAASEADITPSLEVTNPEVQTWLGKYTGLLANRANETLAEKVRAAISEGLREGESYRAMRPRVLEALGCKRDAAGKIIADKQAKYTADRIAHTESHRAVNMGKDVQMKDFGAVRKVWQANAGACPFCAALDGKTIEIEGAFFRRGDTFTIEDEDGNPQAMKLDYSDTDVPPLHPNCCCVTGYEF